MAVNLQEKLRNDLKDAMREKNANRIGALRMALASFEKKIIEKRSRGQGDLLTAEEEISILKSEAKRRKESRDIFISAGRNDLAEKESSELIVLVSYLPPEISEEEIEKVIISLIEKTNEKDFGRLMKEALIALKGQAEGSLVAALIKKHLTK